MDPQRAADDHSRAAHSGPLVRRNIAFAFSPTTAALLSIPNAHLTPKLLQAPYYEAKFPGDRP
jgi:hypothetical protein